MADPLVEARWLIGHHRDPTVVVLDATVLLAVAQFDHDYRVESGRPGWLAGHVPGALHADLLDGPLSDQSATRHYTHPSARDAARELERLGVGDDRRVVVYDRVEGNWAARLWWMLRWLGVDAQVLDGGWDAWRAADGPVNTGDEDERRVAPGSLTVRERPELWADRADVEALVAGERPGAALVCALGAGVYSGEAPSRYARRGHIPGSANLPAGDLLDAEGRQLDVAALRARVTAALGAPERVVLYCGGGISASADALALTRLGLEDVAVYDGSLEEWSADPALPLVR